MPILVHLTDAENVRSIRRSGIRPSRSNGRVFVMPMTASHFVSHQWLREIKRSGARRVVAISLRVASGEMVWAGRYNEEHQCVTVGEAIRRLMALPDPLGFEVFALRRFAPSEIQKMRSVSQVLGWRYMPHAHGQPMCGCPVCMPRGSIGASALRKRLDPIPPTPSLDAVLTQIAAAQSADDLCDALWPLRTKRRKIDPAFLAPLLAIDDDALQQELAKTLPYLRHPKAIAMLRTLARHVNGEVASAALEGLAAVGAPPS